MAESMWREVAGLRGRMLKLAHVGIRVGDVAAVASATTSRTCESLEVYAVLCCSTLSLFALCLCFFLPPWTPSLKFTLLKLHETCSRHVVDRYAKCVVHCVYIAQ